MNPLPGKRWQIASPPPPELSAAAPDLHPAVLQSLYHRGLRTAAEMRAFLAAPATDESPFAMKGVAEATDRIRRALANDEPIVVYGDFDADGVTATALLSQVLYSLGANVRPYIPDREREGYGLNDAALQTIRNRGVGLVVTVDCGIRSVTEAEQARAIGLDLIISDHHTVGAQIPPAYTVINPQQADCGYPFKQLSGVGVAYKLAQALLQAETDAPLHKHTRAVVHPDDLLDLVALGTVSDLVPLVGENRQLVRQGLERINAARRPGVAALMQKAGIRPGMADANGIGFRLGPRLNAAGRLRSGTIAYRLLVAGSIPQATDFAEQLDRLNRERQTLTEQIFERAKEQSDGGFDGPLLLAGAEDFDHGIVGLVAGKLCEAYYRPAIVMRYEADVTRGSARSIPEFHITHALDECRPLLVRYGGHAAAAGFTVANDKRPALLEQLRDLAAKQLDTSALQPTLRIDAEVGFADITLGLWEALRQLEPCGYGNPAPTLCLRGARVEAATVVGQDGTHLKLFLSDGSGRRVEAIAFRKAAWRPDLPDCVDVAFALEINEWNGRRTLQLNVQDLRPAAID